MRSSESNAEAAVEEAARRSRAAASLSAAGELALVRSAADVACEEANARVCEVEGKCARLEQEVAVLRAKWVD